VARGKSRAFDEKYSPLASGPAPLARTLAIAAEAFMNNYAGQSGLVRFVCRMSRQGWGRIRCGVSRISWRGRRHARLARWC